MRGVVAGGVAGLALVVVGAWVIGTQVVGAHVTGCGSDSKGAYAEVRVNNWLGGAHEQPVQVWFFADGAHKAYGGTLASVRVPAHGRGTAVLRGRAPEGGHTLQCSVVAGDMD
jgi:hypothetical protein